jgi:hypothetical protein
VCTARNLKINYAGHRTLTELSFDIRDVSGAGLFSSLFGE